jgi:hypothetical protein
VFACLLPYATTQLRHGESLGRWVPTRGADAQRGAPVTTNEALDAILSLRSIWERKLGRVTLADLGLVLRRCVRSRGHAAMLPERWRLYPSLTYARHVWVLEA